MLEVRRIKSTEYRDYMMKVIIMWCTSVMRSVKKAGEVKMPHPGPLSTVEYIVEREQGGEECDCPVVTCVELAARPVSR
jgi:hypothetical protein